MPTLSEFVLTVGLRRNELEDVTYTTFRIETRRQFRAFRYAVEVESEIDVEARQLSLALKGVQTPSDLMSAVGAGRTELLFPELTGEYSVEISGAKRKGTLRLRGGGGRIELLEIPEGDFVQVRVDDTVEIIRA